MFKLFFLGMVYVTGAFLSYILFSILPNDIEDKYDIACISILWPFSMVILIPCGLVILFNKIGDMIVDQINGIIHRKNENQDDNRKGINYPCSSCPDDQDCTNFRNCSKWLLWASLMDAKARRERGV